MTKFDSSKPLFVGPNAARANSVFDSLRQTVRDLDTGSGVSYEDLQTKFLETFQARSAKNVDAAYVRSYVRDAVGKFGYLSQESASTYSVVEVAAAAPKAPKKPKAPANDSNGDDILKFIAVRGEVEDASFINESKITVETMVEETGKKTKTILAAVESLESQGLVRTEQVEQSLYVFLTEAGYARFQELPEEAATEAPAEEVVSSDTVEEAASEEVATEEVATEEVGDEQNADEEVQP